MTDIRHVASLDDRSKFAPSRSVLMERSWRWEALIQRCRSGGEGSK